MTTPRNIGRWDTRIKREIVPIGVGTASGTSAATLTGGRGYEFDASAEDVLFTFLIPTDYDEEDDYCVFVAPISPTTADGSNYVNFSVTEVRRFSVAAAVEEADATLTNIASIDVQALTKRFIEFDLSGRGLRGGDNISINLEATVTGTAGVAVYLPSVKINSTIAPYDQEDR